MHDNRIRQQTLEQYDIAEFTRDVIDFFSGKRAGHLSKWLYSNPRFPGDKACGVDAWAQVAHDARDGSPYYVFRAEEDIINAAAPCMQNMVVNRGARIIDIGPGSLDAVRGKMSPIIRAFETAVREYVAVDVSEKSLSVAQAEVARAFPFLNASTIRSDFIQDKFSYGQKIRDEIAVLLGLTLCNLPVDPLVSGLPERMLTSSLNRIRAHFSGQNNHLIITQDMNQNTNTLRSAYTTREPVYMTLPHLIARDVPISGDFDPTGFNLDIEFIPQTQACAMSFVSKKGDGIQDRRRHF